MDHSMPRKLILHEVQPGETFQSLSVRYDMALGEVAALNKMPLSHPLMPGDSIFVYDMDDPDDDDGQSGVKRASSADPMVRRKQSVGEKHHDHMLLHHHDTVPRVEVGHHAGHHHEVSRPVSGRRVKTYASMYNERESIMIPGVLTITTEHVVFEPKAEHKAVKAKGILEYQVFRSITDILYVGSVKELPKALSVEQSPNSSRANSRGSPGDRKGFFSSILHRGHHGSHEDPSPIIHHHSAHKGHQHHISDTAALQTVKKMQVVKQLPKVDSADSPGSGSGSPRALEEDKNGMSETAVSAESGGKDQAPDLRDSLNSPGRTSNSTLDSHDMLADDDMALIKVVLKPHNTIYIPAGPGVFSDKKSPSKRVELVFAVPDVLSKEAIEALTYDADGNEYRSNAPVPLPHRATFGGHSTTDKIESDVEETMNEIRISVPDTSTKYLADDDSQDTVAKEASSRTLQDEGETRNSDTVITKQASQRSNPDSHTNGAGAGTGEQNQEEDTPPVIVGESRLVSDTEARILMRSVPYQYRNYSWSLLFATWQDGVSMSTFYRRMADYEEGPIFLVVGDEKGHVFGGYGSEPFRVSDRCLGNGECFLFSVRPKLAVYHWTRKNDYFMFGGNSSIFMGCGDGIFSNRHARSGLAHFGIWLDEYFDHGHSSYSRTFNNPSLAATEEFRAKTTEVWGLIEVEED
eukprot:Clim_evm88s243 gene=Clim_evmTU88s243